MILAKTFDKIEVGKVYPHQENKVLFANKGKQGLFVFQKKEDEIMRKGILVLLVASLLVGTGGAVLAKGDEVNVKVNGSLINFPDAKPYIDPTNSRTMVPARFVSEALGYQVFWNEAHRKVIIQKTINGKGFIVTLKEGENKAEVDGKQVTFDAKAVIKDNRTFVPLRFVSESFGADVDWMDKERLVVITTGDGTGAVPGNSAGTMTPSTGGTGTMPGNTPSNGTGTSPAGVGEKVGADKQFTVIAPSLPDLLLPKDSDTEPAVQSFLDSLSFDKSTSTLRGKIPTNIPKGYIFTLDFDTNGKNTRLQLKEGEVFELPVAGKDSGLFFALAVYPELKNSVSVNLPAMTVEWGTKR
ncbi:copper amine oxidase N-terminal domain-containing protein [Brevibacillus porteri]|uniref:copper amine oxidase N-terminal domain-containing protein n=1 Tax=Brevibacillus porteri TaxID=2126350 RepID=UPI003D2497FD